MYSNEKRQCKGGDGPANISRILPIFPEMKPKIRKNLGHFMSFAPPIFTSPPQLFRKCAGPENDYAYKVNCTSFVYKG